MHKITAIIRSSSLGALGVMAFILGPWFVAVWFGVKPVILPPIGKVIQSGIELVKTNALGPSVCVSLIRVNSGFALAALTAVPLGIVLGRSQRLYLIFEPLIESLRFVIPFAWIPLAILWFGTHEFGKIFIIWYAGFFIILLQTIGGVRGVDPDIVKAAKTLGASERIIFHKVILPAAIPITMTGLRIGFAACWIALIAAEMVASRSGLGYLIMDAREFLQTDVVIAGMVTIAVIGATFNWFFEFLQRKIFRHQVKFNRF